MHIYDWLDIPKTYPPEQLAHEWLDKYTRPAYDKQRDGTAKWLDANPLFCTWRGKEWQVTGASRLGDIWLKAPNSRNHYDERVNIDDCTNWRKTLNPGGSGQISA